ncbi:MAG TPA: prepilin peptidase [Victivallales bacterium]|nr:prepilin peptidase [Victivallales bacterium]HPO90748.1 prepilin peptidase [Victivallales bacterium]HRR06131.1 prepilin peptidase [Victivallales bacterium]HRR28393.1 prepilin peptidase [Victivallales bacterium]HRU00150.1 prepilin peptidase [Victivallales bacterium]
MREIIYILLVPLLSISAYTEIRFRTIPNWLTIGILLASFVSSFLIGGSMMLKSSFLGFFWGFIVFLPFCLAGVLGGGDLKLMGAVGSIVAFPTILLVLYYTVLAGGLMAIVYAIWNGVFFSTLSDLFKILIGRKKTNPKGLKKVPVVPYGIAIGLGTLWTLLLSLNIL